MDLWSIDAMDPSHPALCFAYDMMMENKRLTEERDQLRAELAEETTRRAQAQAMIDTTLAHESASRSRADLLTCFLRDEIHRLEEGSVGGTHWDGCESAHQRCAAILRMRKAIAGTVAPEPVRVEMPAEYVGSCEADFEYETGYNRALEECAALFRKAGHIPTRNGKEVL